MNLKDSLDDKIEVEKFNEVLSKNSQTFRRLLIPKITYDTKEYGNYERLSFL